MSRTVDHATLRSARARHTHGHRPRGVASRVLRGPARRQWSPRAQLSNAFGEHRSPPLGRLPVFGRRAIGSGNLSSGAPSKCEGAHPRSACRPVRHACRSTRVCGPRSVRGRVRPPRLGANGECRWAGVRLREHCEPIRSQHLPRERLSAGYRRVSSEPSEFPKCEPSAAQDPPHRPLTARAWYHLTKVRSNSDRSRLACCRADVRARRVLPRPPSPPPQASFSVPPRVTCTAFPVSTSPSWARLLCHAWWYILCALPRLRGQRTGRGCAA